MGKGLAMQEPGLKSSDPPGVAAPNASKVRREAETGETLEVQRPASLHMQQGRTKRPASNKVEGQD